MGSAQNDKNTKNMDHPILGYRILYRTPLFIADVKLKEITGGNEEENKNFNSDLSTEAQSRFLFAAHHLLKQPALFLRNCFRRNDQSEYNTLQDDIYEALKKTAAFVEEEQRVEKSSKKFIAVDSAVYKKPENSAFFAKIENILSKQDSELHFVTSTQLEELFKKLQINIEETYARTDEEHNPMYLHIYHVK